MLHQKIHRPVMPTMKHYQFEKSYKATYDLLIDQEESIYNSLSNNVCNAAFSEDDDYYQLSLLHIFLCLAICIKNFYLIL